MPAIRIANGDLFDPWNPGSWVGPYADPMKMDWNWLGHHLANECRYAGGSRWYYSVAQHSVLASRHVKWGWGADGVTYLQETKIRLAALLHDATEATLKDIPGPFKSKPAFREPWGASYKDVEHSLGEWIYKQFGLGKEYLDAPPIKAIDKELLDAERFVLFPDSGYAYCGSIRIEPWDREYARDEFNRTLLQLTR